MICMAKYLACNSFKNILYNTSIFSNFCCWSSILCCTFLISICVLDTSFCCLDRSCCIYWVVLWNSSSLSPYFFKDVSTMEITCDLMKPWNHSWPTTKLPNAKKRHKVNVLIQSFRSARNPREKKKKVIMIEAIRIITYCISHYV